MDEVGFLSQSNLLFFVYSSQLLLLVFISSYSVSHQFANRYASEPHLIVRAKGKKNWQVFVWEWVSEEKSKNKTADEEKIKKKISFLASVVRFASLEPQLLLYLWKSLSIICAICGATRETPSCDTNKQVIISGNTSILKHSRSLINELDEKRGQLRD